MSTTVNTRAEIEQLKQKISTLLNKQLINICQLSGLKQSGVKADLQRRIIYALYENQSTDLATYAHIKESINNVMGGGRGSHQSTGSSSAAYGRGATGVFNNTTTTNGGSHMSPSPHLGQPVFGQNGFTPGYGAQPRVANGYGGSASTAAVAQKSALQFKSSPFHRVEQMLGNYKVLEAMSNHRNALTITLKSNEPALSRCIVDKSMRVMVFCAGDLNGLQDITFPYQSELKVNGGEIKANLRGLKNKSGTTRPVDITDSLRLDKHSYQNNVEFTYALTNKVKTNPKRGNGQKERFYLALYLCKQVAIDELVTKIKGRKILKASVLLELTKKANDPDIIAGPQKITLQCPLTMGRLKNPCRSTTCQHIQCFDVTSYLHLQEQASQWLCPVCNNLATFENLAIDEYVKDVLDHTREDTEAVIIEPDGHWRTESPEVPEPRRSRVLNAVSAISIKLDDDDIVALDDFSSPSGRNTLTPNRSMFGTPSLNGATANGSSSTPSGSRKRTAEVIDLTLDSDDEDDRAIVAPAPKRQYTAGAASITDWSKYPQAGADWNN